MRLYAESSAILAWLFGETRSDAVHEALVRAHLILASQLTLVECHRAIVRGSAGGRFSESLASDMRAELEASATCWNLLRLGDEILERARRPFPGEPVRTLDALHLASALAARASVSGLAILSLDQRVRATARALGFEVIPG